MPNNMTIAGLATIPQRAQELKNALDSICPQVDVVYVYLNNFDHIPDLPQNAIAIQYKDLGDAGKFYAMTADLDCEYFFSCDDDLIYPFDYVERMKEKINELNCIVTAHGRTFNHAPINSYYRDYSVKYRCLDEVQFDTKVQFGGTGCMGFKPSYFRPNYFPTANMADIHVAIQANKENKKIMCISHQKNWIKYQQVSNTIYERFKFDDSVQTQFVNSVVW